MKKVFFLSLLFSCFTTFSVFANSSENSVSLECTSDAPMINAEANFANCMSVRLTCWPNYQTVCFDDSYSALEIYGLLRAMEREWCPGENETPGN